MPKISLDFETRSMADLKKCDAYKSAEHPSSEVLVVAVKEGRLNDPTPLLSWDITRPHNEALDLLRTAIVEGWEIHAYNSQYEWVYLKYVCPRQFGFPVPDINNMRCTMAVARLCGLPRSLAKAAEFLRLSVRKDAIGGALIRRFSIPNKAGEFARWDDDATFTLGGERTTSAEAFQKFVAYCEQDVRTEMAVSEALHKYRLRGYALDSFLATARLNDRGVPVDRKALEHAYRLYQEHEEALTGEYHRITGLRPAQTGASLKWMREHGYPGHSLNKENRERWAGCEALTPDAKRVLSIKGELSFAAVKKIPAMLNKVMDDGRIRGSFLWCGAQKTWRWTSEGVQWQNMKKPSKALRPVIENAYNDVADEIDLELFGLCYGDPYEVIASLARYFVRFPDAKIFDLDFSQVEARILPMLVECDRVMEKFKTGEDIYVETAEMLERVLKERFDVPFAITRDLSKTVSLACQFQGGWHAVFTATGNKWERPWCEVAAAVVRKTNPEYVVAWRAFQDAFVSAMNRPGKWFKATKYVSFGYAPHDPFPRMLMKLPSGRPIIMPYPEKDPYTMVQVIEDRGAGKDPKKTWERLAGHWESAEEIHEELGIGCSFRRGNKKERVGKWFPTWELSYYGHVKGGRYGRVKTYGGSLLQGSTQGTGVDLLAAGVLAAEKAGFEPFFLVHDQCLAPAVGDPEEFVRKLCTVPDWFEGFPLEADLKIVRSYCK